MPDTAVESPTPETQPTATPETQAPVSDSGTAQTPPSEAQESIEPQAAPGEETFFSGDPKSLPPELREHYTNMLRDYKTKTQKVAEERKSLEAIKKKAEIYDHISADQNFMNYWQGRIAGQNQQQTAQPQVPQVNLTQEEFQKAFESPDNFLSFMDKYHEARSFQTKRELAEAKMAIQAAAANELVENYANAKDPEGKPLRPMFDQLTNMGLITFFVNQDPPRNNAEWEGKLDRAYKSAEALYRNIYQKGKEEALKVVQKKSAQSTQPPTNSPGVSYTGPDPKNLSVKEAIELARKGIRIPT